MQPEVVSLALAATAAIAFPVLALALLCASMIVWRAPDERTTGRVVVGALTASFVSALATAYFLWKSGQPSVQLPFGQWFSVGDYGFELSLYIDWLSVRIMLLSSAITLLVGRFSITYLHAEAGFARFFVQLALFASGALLVVMGGTIDILFMGWECVGLSSAMLVAFFHERDAPARASVWVFATYRLCDVGLLVAAVLVHEAAHTVSFAHLFCASAWPSVASVLPLSTVGWIGVCLCVAAMGKSAQFPVGNWLPRAMEGPTPSSALFYGGISVHLGVYLLLRMSPVFAASTSASAALVIVGATTALYATVVWRVQTDLKSRIAYATMTQLGLMFVECGTGHFVLASWHLTFHALLRTYQLLRAPSGLHDDHLLRAANHGHGFAMGTWLAGLIPQAVQRRGYLLALERLHLDGLQRQWFVENFRDLGRIADGLERKHVGAGRRTGRSRLRKVATTLRGRRRAEDPRG